MKEPHQNAVQRRHLCFCPPFKEWHCKEHKRRKLIKQPFNDEPNVSCSSPSREASLWEKQPSVKARPTAMVSFLGRKHHEDTQREPELPRPAFTLKLERRLAFPISFAHHGFEKKKNMVQMLARAPHWRSHRFSMSPSTQFFACIMEALAPLPVQRVFLSEGKEKELASGLLYFTHQGRGSLTEVRRCMSPKQR